MSVLLLLLLLELLELNELDELEEQIQQSHGSLSVRSQSLSPNKNAGSIKHDKSSGSSGPPMIVLVAAPFIHILGLPTTSPTPGNISVG